MARPVSVEQAAGVAAQFGVQDARVEPLGHGLINDTFAVESATGSQVLQRVHPVFKPEIHGNIAAVTARLRARGLVTPVLLPATDGALWHTDEDGRTWRMMTRIRGVTFDAVSSPGQARAAARALGAFHAALEGLEHPFVGLRQGVHDTPGHVRALRAALRECGGHRLIDQVAPLAASVLAAAAAQPSFSRVPPRIVHGDPKFNNFVFEGVDPRGRERAVGLVDLDTVGPMALHLELGDAWRSWCNPKGEDEASARFDLEVLEASLRGYAEAGVAVTPQEVDAIVYGVELIAVELAIRFLADALRERYFGWNPDLHPSRGEHNLVRARGQWSLFHAARAQRKAVGALVRALL